MDKVNRVSQIDFLRGIAVILVLFRHHAFYHPIQRIGWAGVDLFFVLSGFLVTSLIYKEYLKTKRFSAKTFLIRRAFKIYPLFYLFLGCSLVFTYAAFLLFGYTKNELINKILAEFFFVQNYFEGLWGHTWSLAIEEHFYLFIALFLFVLMRLYPSQINHLHVYFSSILVLILLLRFVNINTGLPIDYRSHIYPTHLRVDSLLWGSLLAYLYHFKKTTLDKFVKFFSPAILFLIGLIILFLTLRFELFSEFMVTIGFSLLYLGFGLILISILYFPDTNSKVFKVMTHNKIYEAVVSVGVFSYSIYLFHMFLPAIFDNADFFTSIDLRVRFLIYFFFSIGVGSAFTKLVESPMLRLRDRLFPKKTQEVLE